MKKITLLLCAVFAFALQGNAQLTEDFETAAPTGWTFFNADAADAGFVQTIARAHGGSSSFYHSDNNIDAAADSWMVSPAYTCGSAEELSFWYNHNYTPTYYNYSGVWISTASGDPIANPGDFTELQEINEAYGFSEDTWTQAIMDLAAYAGETVYVAFKYTGDYEHHLYIDDFSIDVAPSCLLPSAMAAANVTATTADLSWTASTSAETMWEIVYSTNPYAQPSNSMTDASAEPGYTHVTETSLNLTGLSSSTDFQVYYRGHCGGTDYSDWVGPVDFTTLCAAVSTDLLEDFSTMPANCWSEAEGAYGAPTGTTSAWGQDDFGNDTAHANGKAAKINIYGTARDEYIISNEFDLSAGTSYLNFDIALTEWNNSNAATLGADDYVALLVTSDGGTTWSELTRWDASTTIAPTGQAITEIPLTGYTTVKFAIYAFSDTSNEDNDFYVDNFQITASTMRIEENAIEGFTLYPNPVKDQLQLQAQEAISKVTVYNLLGQKVLTVQPNVLSTAIDMAALKTGMYVLKVQVADKLSTYRVLKQ